MKKSNFKKSVMTSF